MLIAYRYLTFFLFPLFVLLIYFRTIFKKEDKIRFKEKIFSSHFKVDRNYNNKLLWFHVASIGELLSILPLIKEINNLNKNIDFLITSVTLSSANLLKKKLNQYNNVTHRFFPLDTEYLSTDFLNQWKPDLVCFVDSEIWPNFLFKIKEKNIPLVLINGRITKKTFKKWSIFPNFAKRVFNNFDLSLACSEESKNNLEALHVKNLSYIGNLKFSVRTENRKLSEPNLKILNKFKVWCAVSTHEEEELIILKTHLEIKKKHNNILTIIAPRHIDRAINVKNLSDKLNLNSQILNDGDTIDSKKEILIINSFGILFEYFNYCKNVFIGKSLIKKLELVGGQNPIEAAKFDCKIYHGPYVYNFQEIYDFLKISNISEQVNDIIFLNQHGDKILKETILKLDKLVKIKNETK